MQQTIVKYNSNAQKKAQFWGIIDEINSEAVKVVQHNGIKESSKERQNIKNIKFRLENMESVRVIYLILFAIVNRYSKRYIFAVLRRYTVSKIKDDQ